MRRGALAVGQKGFTVIESAVVAVIIGVLAAICPSFNGTMALGFLIMALSLLVGQLARRFGAPVAAAAIAGLVTFALGLGLAGKGAQTAPGFGRIIRKAKEAKFTAALVPLRAECRQDADCLKVNTICSCTAIKRTFQTEYEKTLQLHRQERPPDACLAGISQFCSADAAPACVEGQCRMCHGSKEERQCE